MPPARPPLPWQLMWRTLRSLPTILLAAPLTQSAFATPDQSQYANWTDCPGVRSLVGVQTGLAECVAKAGATASEVIEFRLGDSKEALNAQSSMSLDFDPFYFTDTPVNLTWLLNDREFSFNNVGGTGQSVLTLDLDYNDRGLNRVTFEWQNRPLNLAEAMARAKMLEAWLIDAGYVPLMIDGEPMRPFAIVERNVYPLKQKATDWASAEATLSSEDDFVNRMRLYRLALADTEVMVVVDNGRRSAWNFGGRQSDPPGFRRSIYDGTGGYEWSLEISIQRKPAA